MQLKKLQAAIGAYREHLLGQRFYADTYKWEILKNFQDHWDPAASQLAQMYDQSLQSSHTRRWWKGENFQPKEMMIRFLEASPDFARRSFEDLFNEEKAIEGRVSRFLFACDVLLEDYKKDHPLSIDNNHFHADNHMISLYLGLRYPEQYTVIFYPEFRSFLEKIGMRNPPSPFDYERFFKICRTLYSFIQKDEALLNWQVNQLQVGQHYLGPNIWIVQGLYEFGHQQL